MTLLNSILANPLDADYQEAAAQAQARADAGRDGGGSRGGGRWPTWISLAAVAIIIGLGLTWGVRELRRPDPRDAKARTLLEADARRATDDVHALTSRATELTAQLEALRHQVLAQSDPSAAARGRQLSVAAGVLPASGPGLSVSLDQPAGTSGDARLQAGDLRVIIGALWQAGAEAVSVGDIRLTSLTAVRDVGDVIQVDLTPLVTPYRIWAIGPTGAMQLALAEGAAGARVALLRDYLGVRVAIEPHEHVELPAAAVGALRFAQPTPEPRSEP
jgi:uncharacterized protein YlxW (UPF0749 family)